MSNRLLVLLALLLVASVLSAVVAHACPELKFTEAMAQAPCDHNAREGDPLGKDETGNCDSVRYGMLSTQASPLEATLFNLRTLLVCETLAVVSPARVLPLLAQAQASAFHRSGNSPNLSRVVLRI
jgi:hypothetical protein